MAGPLLADRIKETSTTTGTGTLTLAGAATGFRAFSTFADADTCYYVIVAVNGSGAPTGAWEVGIGTVGGTGTTLARTSVLSSSNAGAAVNFGAGTKHVFCDQPADDSAAVKQYAGLGIGTAGVAGVLSTPAIFASGEQSTLYALATLTVQMGSNVDGTPSAYGGNFEVLVNDGVDQTAQFILQGTTGLYSWQSGAAVMSFDNTGLLTVSGSVSASGYTAGVDPGVSGTFDNTNTVTVVGGIITNIA